MLEIKSGHFGKIYNKVVKLEFFSHNSTSPKSNIK